MRDLPPPGPAWRYVAVGLVGGVLSGLLGVGGGFIMVPLLVLWAAMPQRRANGTSLLAIVPIAMAGALVYYFRTARPQVDLVFALYLVIGSVFGAYLGARAMNRIPERLLAPAVAAVLLLVGLKEMLLP